MKLSLKFNIVLVGTFTVGIAAAGVISYQMLQENARDEILHTADMVMEGAFAVRDYTIQEIKPILATHGQDEFLPQTVPAYAAMKNIEGLRKKFPEYSYKEATLNPTNPTSRATDWETSIVEYFRNNSSETQVVGEHSTAVGPSLYIAKPIRIENAGCLTCHGKVEDAPQAMKTKYGVEGGFGWQLNEVVGAQIVNVPMSVALDRAQKTFYTFMGALLLVFVTILVFLNILLHRIVIKPVKQLSGVANDVSMGAMDLPDLDTNNNDEIGDLSKSFNRMKRSLDNAMKMLDE